MAKIALGDIFEINTHQGNAYLHYIHEDKTIGSLIRVLPGLYSDRPSDMDKISNLKERYMISFPLAAANRRKLVEHVGFSPADQFNKPRFMRDDHFVRGEFLGWFIIDTNTWHRQLVKKLNEEQKKLSPWGIWNDTLLIEKLIKNWKLEDWV